jgi:hypothetical protein
MQIEKKLIVCSILAIVIGIATVAPLAYLMSPVSAQSDETTPWFNIKITYAKYSANLGDSNGPLTPYSIDHSITVKYPLNPEAVNSIKNARAEYFELQVYSNLGQIENLTESIGANCDGTYNPTQNFTFHRENWSNTNYSGGVGLFMSQFNAFSYSFTQPRSFGTSSNSYSSNIYSNRPESLPKIFLNIYNAEKIYIDVRRVGIVSFNGNSTIVTLTDNSVIQHLELTKQGNEFVSGEKPPKG